MINHINVFGQVAKDTYMGGYLDPGLTTHMGILGQVAKDIYMNGHLGMRMTTHINIIMASFF